MKEQNLIQVMAQDLGIDRYSMETDQSYRGRVVYSASRFWIQAFCIDDGVGGGEGISRSLLMRRLRSWLTDLVSFYPELDAWIDDQRRYKSLYKNLIMTRDLVSFDKGEHYRCPQRHFVPISESHEALIGFCDATSAPQRGSTILSGQMLIRPQQGTNGIPLSVNPQWWEVPPEYYRWTSIESLGAIEFLDTKQYGYKLNDSSIWRASLPQESEYWLSRQKQEFGEDEFYCIHHRGKVIEARQISCQEAGQLCTHLRNKTGNAIKATLTRLDAQHTKIFTPFRWCPPEATRWLNAMTWPISGPQNSFGRIIRNEFLDTACSILNACEIVIGE